MMQIIGIIVFWGLGGPAILVAAFWLCENPSFLFAIFAFFIAAFIPMCVAQELKERKERRLADQRLTANAAASAALGAWLAKRDEIRTPLAPLRTVPNKVVEPLPVGNYYKGIGSSGTADDGNLHRKA